MKTFQQFNESLKKWLVKTGTKGIRNVKFNIPSQYKSQIPKKVSKLFKPKNVEKFQSKVNKLMSKGVEFGKPRTASQEVKKELGMNLIAKNRIKNNQPFSATTPPLATARLGYQDGVKTGAGAGKVQLQGKLKGGEYKVKMSGKGDKGVHGSVGGYEGKGNKALRRSGQADKIRDYEKTGTKPTPVFRRTKSELGTAITDITKPGLQTSPHKFNKGDLYGLSVDIKQSKENSRRIREFIRQNQKRMANIKKGKGPVGMSEGIGKAIAGKVFGKTWQGRAFRGSLLAPDSLGTSKVGQVLNPFYKAATDAAFTGPATVPVFGASLLSRTVGPGLVKVGKEVEKNRVKHDKTVTKALKNSPSNKGKSAGEIEQQKNRYMGSIKGVDGALHKGYKPIKI
jgi:hypothetical protein